MDTPSCDCQVCQGMCANSTCLPTPQEVRALIKAGHGNRLATYTWGGKYYIAPAPKGREGDRGLVSTKIGACTFFDGKHCEIHGKLKPLEGRLALHDRPWKPIRFHVMQTWRGKQFESVLKALDKSVNPAVQ